MASGTGCGRWFPEGPDAERVMTLIAAVAAGPITVDDDSERYKSALRYRDERRMSRSCEEDPAFDYILTLFLESADDAASPPRPATGLLINPHESVKQLLDRSTRATHPDVAGHPNQAGAQGRDRP